MRNVICILIITFSFTIFSCTENKNEHTNNTTKINYPDTVSLGDVSLSDTIRGEIKITNEGRNDLVLKKVTASCQCTTPIYDSLPVKANNATKIRVGIYLKDTGYFEKNIVFEANTDSIYQVVVVRGNAIK